MNVGRCFLCLGATKWAGWTRKLPCWTHVGQWLDTCLTEVLASKNCLVGRMLDIVRARVGQRLLFRCLVAVILDTSVINVIPKRAAKQMLTLTSHLATKTSPKRSSVLAVSLLKPNSLVNTPAAMDRTSSPEAPWCRNWPLGPERSWEFKKEASSDTVRPTPHHHSAIHTSTCPPACFITQYMGGQIETCISLLSDSDRSEIKFRFVVRGF